MKTVILKLDGSPADEDLVARAAKIIAEGGLVAFPTETVYGLGANAFFRDAVEKIYAAKQRPEWDPVITHAESAEALALLAGPAFEFQKFKDFIPGPLTVVVKREGTDPRLVTESAGKISLRVPALPAARRLIKLAGVPVAAPSANRFGRPSPTTAGHVLEDLDGRIDAILDGGPVSVGVESTVLDITGPVPVILRPGGALREDLEKVLGPVNLFEGAAGETAQASPGMSARHYSPRAKVILTAGNQKALSEAAGNTRSGVMLPSGWQVSGPWEVFEWGDWDNPEQLASRLFLGFRELDRKGVEAIICPMPQPLGLGLAIQNRLVRAAARNPASK